MTAGQSDTHDAAYIPNIRGLGKELSGLIRHTGQCDHCREIGVSQENLIEKLGMNRVNEIDLFAHVLVNE